MNNGFAALKQHIPLTHRAKKMSKVETLRCAVEYIRDLKDMLDINGALLTSPGSSHSESDSDQGVRAAQFGQAFVEAFSHSQQFFSGESNNGTTTVPAGSHQLSPSSSEDPSSPSYASEASSYITSSNANTNANNNNNMQYDYENYEPVSPEDEELLDAISWWQQS